VTTKHGEHNHNVHKNYKQYESVDITNQQSNTYKLGAQAEVIPSCLTSIHIAHGHITGRAKFLSESTCSRTFISSTFTQNYKTYTIICKLDTFNNLKHYMQGHYVITVEHLSHVCYNSKQSNNYIQLPLCKKQ
jgi:hypothetical protein